MQYILDQLLANATTKMMGLIEALVALAKVEASMGAGMGVGGAAEPLESRAGAHGPMKYKLTNTYTTCSIEHL